MGAQNVTRYDSRGAIAKLLRSREERFASSATVSKSCHVSDSGLIHIQAPTRGLHFHVAEINTSKRGYEPVALRPCTTIS